MRKNIYLFLLFLVVLAFEAAHSVAAAYAQEPAITKVCASVHTFVDSDGVKHHKCQTPEGEILPLVEGNVERLSPSEVVLSVEPPQVDKSIFVNIAVGGVFIFVVLVIVAYSLSKGTQINNIGLS